MKDWTFYVENWYNDDDMGWEARIEDPVEISSEVVILLVKKANKP